MDSCVKCLINGGGETMSSKVEKLDVPIWQRYTMTIDEHIFILDARGFGRLYQKIHMHRIY